MRTDKIANEEKTDLWFGGTGSVPSAKGADEEKTDDTEVVPPEKKRSTNKEFPHAFTKLDHPGGGDVPGAW